MNDLPTLLLRYHDKCELFVHSVKKAEGSF